MKKGSKLTFVTKLAFATNKGNMAFSAFQYCLKGAGFTKGTDNPKYDKEQKCNKMCIFSMWRSLVYV